MYVVYTDWFVVNLWWTVRCESNKIANHTHRHTYQRQHSWEAEGEKKSNFRSNLSTEKKETQKFRQSKRENLYRILRTAITSRDYCRIVVIIRHHLKKNQFFVDSIVQLVNGGALYSALRGISGYTHFGDYECDHDEMKAIARTLIYLKHHFQYLFWLKSNFASIFRSFCLYFESHFFFQLKTISVNKSEQDIKRIEYYRIKTNEARIERRRRKNT